MIANRYIRTGPRNLRILNILFPNLPHPTVTLPSMPHNQWTHVDDHASPALVELLDLTLTRPLAGELVPHRVRIFLIILALSEYVAQHVVDAVENGSTHPRSFFSGVRGRQSQPGNNAKQVTFVLDVLSRSHTTMPTVLATLVYIDRVSPRLHIVCDDFAFERVFLGALIVARKVCHVQVYDLQYLNSLP